MLHVGNADHIEGQTDVRPTSWKERLLTLTLTYLTIAFADTEQATAVTGHK